MPRWLYTGLLYIALLPAVLAAAWRGWRNPANRIDIAQRLGLCPPATRPHPLWIHAVSVGEVQAAAGLVAELRRRFPGQPVVFTSSSGPGMARARQLFSGPLAEPGVDLCFAPVDLPDAIGRFLSRQAPCGLVLTESELWPNWIEACRRRGIPVALVSGRLSARSVRRYQRVARRLMAHTLGGLRFLGAQTTADADRFLQLGAVPEAVAVVGNLKFDTPLPADLDRRVRQLAEHWSCGQRWTWVAGSTHAGEEEVVLEAHRQLVASWQACGAPGEPPLLVLAPRLPARFDAVADALRRGGIAFRRHSGLKGHGQAPPQVWLLDTLGELQAAYGCGQVAFVGGSLVPVGGHNLLEPAALGLPLLAGPRQRNAPDVAAILQDSGALVLVEDARTLALQLSVLLADASLRQRRGDAARACWKEHRGAAARCVDVMAPWLAATG